MFDKIVVPTDGSELAEKAVDFAIEYCRRTGATMTALHVRSPQPISEVVSLSDYGSGAVPALTPEMIIERMEGHGRELLEAVARRARAKGVECATELAVNEHPYRAIIEAAENQGCGMIFMSSHGRSGVEALLLGSVTQKVLTHSKIPVLVFR
ncbi:MAG: universal stress protein [Burkholderiales bacterium]